MILSSFFLQTKCDKAMLLAH